MSTTVYSSNSPLLVDPVADTPADREEFAARPRLLLMEPDPALRRVLASALLRLGCVLNFKRDLESLKATIATGDYSGAIVALDTDLAPVIQLSSAAPPGFRLAIVAHAPPDPVLARRLPDVRFLQKPFDLRELLVILNLPARAEIIKRD
ncbi:MAG: hypothetical protein HZB53_02235 [Chloroflexi bacterium]|nr:hypothetical protein [Chloroflexota bacterium]